MYLVLLLYTYLQRFVIMATSNKENNHLHKCEYMKTSRHIKVTSSLSVTIENMHYRLKKNLVFTEIKTYVYSSALHSNTVLMLGTTKGI